MKALVQAPQKPLRILGIMTGTSCDGMELACLEFRSPDAQSPWKTLWQASAAYPSRLRQEVLALQDPKKTLSLLTLLQLNRKLGVWYGASVQAALKRHKAQPHVLANHGQTVAHHPTRLPKLPAQLQGQGGVTLQLGDGAQLAFATGLTVIQQFRLGDLAAGGQGAPLVPRFHQNLIHKLATPEEARSGIALHNLGGISNFSYLDPKGQLLACDTGPANLWIDAAVQQVTNHAQLFDRGGRLAAAHRTDQKAVDQLLNTIAFFQAPPPKSTGRDDFPFHLLLKATRHRDARLISTATALTSQSIAQAYQTWILQKKRPLKAIYFCGGGAKNLTLLNQIQALLPQVKVARLEDWGLDSSWIEATAFAYFGLLALLGQPLGGAWTGATRGFAPPAQILPGANWRQVLQFLNPPPAA